jgi:hypothetical protein
LLYINIEFYYFNFILAVKSSLFVIGNLGALMRIRNTDRNQQKISKNLLIVRPQDSVHFMRKVGIPKTSRKVLDFPALSE